MLLPIESICICAEEPFCIGASVVVKGGTTLVGGCKSPILRELKGSKLSRDGDESLYRCSTGRLKGPFGARSQSSETSCLKFSISIGLMIADQAPHIIVAGLTCNSRQQN